MVWYVWMLKLRTSSLTPMAQSVEARSGEVNLSTPFGAVKVHLVHGTGAQPTIASVPAQQFLIAPNTPRTSSCTGWYPLAAPAAAAPSPQVAARSAPSQATPVPKASQAIAAGKPSQSQASSPGILLSKGLCRQSTVENLATYFDHGRRRTTEAPKASAEAPKSPGRRMSQATSVLPKHLTSSDDLQLSSPRGPETWAHANRRVKHAIDRVDRLHHGPNPRELPEEVTSHRKLMHGKATEGQERHGSQASQQSSPRLRTDSIEAAHRKSSGVWSCFDTTSAGESHSCRKQRSLPHHKSCGAARGMQVKTEKPETLEENPSGEETSSGFPFSRRSREKRHQTPRPSGNLADGLSTRSLEEWHDLAVGGKRRGMQSDGAKAYCRGGPGPWDPVPEGVKKDGWGRLSPREPPAQRSRVPFGTSENLESSDQGSRSSQKVKRLASAPPVLQLPYGSDVDVKEPSKPSISGRSSELRADGPTAVTPKRSISADWRGKSLLSSQFVEGQRASNHSRGGRARLVSGGNLVHGFFQRPQSEQQGSSKLQKSVACPKMVVLAPPNPKLDEAYKKCLDSLQCEIEQLQSRSTRLEKEVHKTAFENGLKSRPLPQLDQS